MMLAVRLAVVALSSAAYVGLAILGWGGFAAFFSHPARIALTIVLFATSGAALFAVVLFAAAGGALRIWPVFVLGRRFSGLVAIQPGHTLVTNGIYRAIRHPSYLGLLLAALGWGLAFRSGVGLLLTALLIPPLVARMNAEERLLRTHFGREYDAYRARTSRMIPRLY
jgi:protein-S-isoprenylcysteine O-methyltransferase Ste14